MRNRGRPSIERVLQVFKDFIHTEASAGILLLFCTIIALAWANSPWGNSYTQLWNMKLTVGLDNFNLSKPLILWINDGLMAIFFFVVGLEIKREMLCGELSSIKQAALPFAAALGGMVVPALLFIAININQESLPGWGIPMATDIAFALGILALLGSKVPISLKVFLTALAIVDDIGAVIVIALFYTAKLSLVSLGIAAFFLICLIITNRMDVRNPLIYTILGIGLWIAFLKSGIHATVAGVLLAMTIPARVRISADIFVAQGRELLNDFERASGADGQEGNSTEQQEAIQSLETACEQAQTPLQRLEHALHPWVAFLIMPIFAFANAGVTLGGDIFTTLLQPVSLGIIAGLVFGKQIGITLFAWLAVKFRLAILPDSLNWRQIYGVSLLGGIGFTMSLFISSLAFADTAFLSMAKIGILLASLISGVAGWLVLRFTIGLAMRYSRDHQNQLLPRPH